MSNFISRFFYWIPAICVAIMISLFSTHYFSAEQTGHLIIPLLHRFWPSMSERELRVAHILFRKMAHVTEFGIFSTAVFHGLRGPRHGWRWDWAVLTLVIAAAYAALDEWHQSFVPLREPRVRDVMIDALGAFLAQVIVWIYAKWHRSPADSTGLRATSD
jgi:VanZ family protein